MSAAIAPLVEGLRDAGFARVTVGLDLAAYRNLADSLGRIVGEERIALRPGAHAYVAKAGRVPLHTDHPDVEVIGWLCVEQDGQDGASMLLDARPVAQSLLEEERALLRQVELECPPLAGGPPTERRPVLRQTPTGDAIFCSPWLRSARPIPGHEEVLDGFRLRLSEEAKRAAIEIRLDPGEALFIDNQRVLHGRRPIAETSRRRLERVWIRRRESA